MTNKLHPLIAGAAVTVIIASLTGVAALSGLIGAKAVPAPAVDHIINLERGGQPTPHNAWIQPHTAQSHQLISHPVYTQHRVAVCFNCGTVDSIVPVTQSAPQTSGVGVGLGAVVGGLLGNQVGKGNGRTLATIAGAVGGGYAGNEIERRTKTSTVYRYHVHMTDGGERTFIQPTATFQVGAHVHVVNGHLEN